MTTMRLYLHIIIILIDIRGGFRIHEIIIFKTTKCNLKRLLTHSAVEAARVPHGGLRVMIVCGGQVTVGQSHRILLVSWWRHGSAHFRADGHIFDELLGLAVGSLDEVWHSGSQSAVVRVVCKPKICFY